MSNLKQKHKDYLIKNGIKDLTDLVNYVEILRNTSNLQGEDRQMLFDFAFLIVNEQSSLKSFFAENKNPSKEFYNAFKQSTSSPTFMDEVLEQANKEKWNPLDELHKRAAKEMFNTIKDEDGQFNSTCQGETHTEVPIWLTNEYRLGFKDSEKYIKIEFDDSKQKFGKKETEGKLNYELDWEFIQQLAERMSQNKGKYKPYNWMQPIDVEKLKQSLFRHVVEVMKGNYEDDGRTFGHLESISANVMMINYQLKNSVK